MSLRTSILAVALALVASACVSKPPTPGAGGEPTTPSTKRATSGSTPSPKQSPTRSDGGSQPDGARTATSAPGSSYADDQGVGAMARAYLQGSPATSMVVEVDYVQGNQPRQAAMDHLQDILRQYCRKSGGVTVKVDDAIPSQDSSYSFEEIGQLERRYRDRRSSGSTATMWLVYLNGSLAGEDGTLGVAYKASAAAIFPDEINSASTALVQSTAIERSVVTHETGHLLGLINLVARSAYDHEDPDHPYHSRYKDSVMYWAIEDVSIAALLSGGPPDTFDQYDEADLAALRG